MAVPKRRTSITKKRMRRTHLKIEAKSVVKCPNCGAIIQPHRACTKCGFYKGKNVLNKDVVVEEKNEKTTAKTAKEEKVEAPKKATTKKASSKKEKKSKETK